MCEGNWIKINRKILEWGWYTDINTKVLFLHLLLTVNYKDGELKGIEIKRGQTLKSVNKLAIETGLSEKNVRTAIEHLKKTGEVASQTTRYGQLITVENYAFYQDQQNQDGNEAASNWQGDGKEAATKWQGSGNSLRKKEGKEGKKVRNTNPPIPPFQRYGEYGHVKLTAEQYEKLVNDFGQGTANGGIKVVDEYCEMSKKRYANYNLAIRKWGIDRAREDEKKNGSGSRAEVTPEQDYDDWCRRMAEIAGDNSGNLKSGSNDPFQ